MDRIRPAAVAGAFYSSDSEGLSALIEDCFVSNPLGPKGIKESRPLPIGGMVPHAGYTYSGACAAHFYARLDSPVQRIILLGVNHRGQGHRAALSLSDFWETPLGEVRVDHEPDEFLFRRAGFLEHDELAHVGEHSIEVQLPFLQKVLGDFTLIPISLSHLKVEECAQLGQAIADVYQSETSKTAILASSDLSHYLSPQETERLDQIALENVLAMNPAALLSVVEENNISMCGVVPTAVLLYALNALGVKHARLLQHCHSGHVTPMQEVVGYASVSFEL